MTGGIPLSIGNLTHLVWLNVNDNGLSGEISPKLFNHGSPLRFLFLAINDFSGNIPSTIVNCQNLTFFHAYENALAGIIPRNIGDLQFLTSLLLKGNNLTGTVPASLGTIKTLTELDLSFNRMEGVEPGSFTYSISRCSIYGNTLPCLPSVDLYGCKADPCTLCPIKDVSQIYNATISAEAGEVKFLFI